jgi:hypothetical protein
VAYYLGLDLGQSSEPTALAVMEDRTRGEERHLFLRHLERYPIHTRYPQIADQVKERVEDRELTTAIHEPWDPDPVEYVPPELVVDITGVGKPVVDIFKKRYGLKFRTVGIVGSGENSSCTRAGYDLPKRDLIASLEVPLHEHRFHAASGLPLWEDLRKELLNYRRKISLGKRAQDTLVYWREGTHDDLLLATALACWWASRGGGRFYRAMPKPAGF